MKIKSVSVRGYRTIKDELSFDIDGAVTLVGPNNSGKTNTLRALHCFFTGYENSLGYDFSTDTCKGEKSLRTNIQITFAEISAESDGELVEAIQSIRELLKVSAPTPDEITLYLTFSPNSNPVYRAYPNVRRPKQSDGVAYSRAEKKLFEYIFEKFSIHYIPSEKSIEGIYENLILPFLLKQVHGVLLEHLPRVKAALTDTANEIKNTLHTAGLQHFNPSFEIPKSADEMLKTVGFNLQDSNITSFFRKGMGIQSAVMLATFCWIARQEQSSGKLSLWLIEEPESYLHPELATQCRLILKELGTLSQVVVTTHSLGFVPQDPNQAVGIQLDGKWTKGSTFKTYHEATSRIKKSLGVKFSDYYNFTRYNVLVEGQTDRDYLQAIIKTISTTENLRLRYPILTGKEIAIFDYGGVKGLEGFLRATHEFILGERAVVTMLDGDDAGNKTRRDLQNYFGNKRISFESNLHFVIVRDRFPIEGLIPDGWINGIRALHPGWFEDYSLDAQGTILPFKIKDQNKRGVLDLFMSMLTPSDFDTWAERWSGVLDALESALRRQDQLISR